MAVDIAFDNTIGDLLATPGNDVGLYSGEAVVAQRMRTRLKIPLGSWILDPTGGSLGSRLYDATRMPVSRAIGEIPMIVKEALLPMTDIRVEDVLVEIDANSANTIGFTVLYVVVDSAGNESDTQQFEGTIPVVG